MAQLKEFSDITITKKVSEKKNVFISSKRKHLIFLRNTQNYATQQ